ncbi:MAG: ribosome maturation factor RimM [Chromatiales bacterium]
MGASPTASDAADGAATVERYVILGKVSGMFGVRGWVRVYSYTRPPFNILNYTPWYLCVAGDWRELAPVEGRMHGKGVIARLADIEGREAARALLGAAIAIRRRQLHALGGGEHYHIDLIGLRVFNREGIELGRVQRLMETGADDVLVVKGEQEYLIPLVAGVHVLEIDEAADRIEVDWGEDY